MALVRGVTDCREAVPSAMFDQADIHLGAVCGYESLIHADTAAKCNHRQHRLRPWIIQ